MDANVTAVSGKDRNALDRARLRQANCIFAGANGPLTASGLSGSTAAGILASRVFTLPPANE